MNLSLYFRHRTVQVLAVIILYLLVAPFLPHKAHETLYTLSTLIKETLIWVLPVTVGFFIAYTMLSFERRAPLFLVLVVLFEAFSNFLSVWYAFFCGKLVSKAIPFLQVSVMQTNFQALWHLPFSKPVWWTPGKGVIIGVIAGCLAAFFHLPWLSQGIHMGKKVMETILTKGFSRLIPIFVVGFLAQLYATQLLSHLVTHYAVLLVELGAFVGLYLLFLFWIGSRSGRLVYNIKSLLPAGGIALTSGCSLSTMPWTIAGAAKTLRNPELAKALIPTTTNIQQVGDCIVNAFLCFLLYKQFYGHAPSLWMWIPFSLVFTMARFATAAIIGGAIFIMLPVYETYLDFNPQMIAIILAFNALLDPLVTSSNVMANGALCSIFEKVWDRVQQLYSPSKKQPSR